MIPALKDVKPPLDEPFHLWWIWLLAVIAIAAIAFAVFYFFRRNKITAPAVPPLLPWEEAHRRLEELRKQGLIQSGKYEAYYTALSGIVRRYIEDRFHIKAPEMTTEEFIASLKHSNVLKDEQKNILRSFLTAADMVKFAKHDPTPQDAQEGLCCVKDLVDSTMPAPSNDV